MKYIFYILVLINLIFSFFACNKYEESFFINDLIQEWGDSREEYLDSEIKTFRPSDKFDFPASRYRLFIDFQKNKKCDYLVCAPTDAHYTETGSWSYYENQNILIVKNPNGVIIYNFEIIELKNDVLKIKSVK